MRDIQKGVNLICELGLFEVRGDDAFQKMGGNRAECLLLLPVKGDGR